MSRTHWLIMPLLATASIIIVVYAPAIHSEYVWDDWQLFAYNPGLRLPGLLWQTLFEPILPGTLYLRPVSLASFALEFRAFGVDAAITHSINIGLHALNTLLVGLIAIRLTQGYALNQRVIRVFVATLFYGLHPALIEPIAWSAGRFDLLVAFFFLAAVYSYLSLSGWLRNALVGFFFLLAALSKEMAATLPLVLVFLFIGIQGRSVSWSSVFRFFVVREWRLYTLLASFALAVIVLRYYFLGAVAIQAPAAGSTFDDIWQHIALIGHSLLFYSKMSLWPYSDLNPQHPFDITSMSAGLRVVGVAVTLVCVIVMTLLLAIRRWYSLMLICWFVTLLPVLNILPIPMMGNIGQERFLTLPLAFLALAVAVLPIRSSGLLSAAMQKSLPILGLTFGALLVAGAVANIRITLPLWKNELTLWAWADARNPYAPVIQNNYAAAAVRYLDFRRAESVLQRLDVYYRNHNDPMLDKQRAITKLIRAEYFIRVGKPQDAIDSLDDALRLSPAPPHEVMLASGYKLGDIQRIKGFDADFFYRSVYTDFATARMMSSEFEAAGKDVDILLLYTPYFPEAWLLKAFAAYGLDHWEEGGMAYRHALEYGIPEANVTAVARRKLILDQLCALEPPPVDVCRRWDLEQASAKSEVVDAGAAEGKSTGLARPNEVRSN